MKRYCESIYQTKRRTTRVVHVGPTGIGGYNPIRIQSMTTTPTHDVDATVDQVMRLSDAGCEIVRVTVQGQKEALSCEKIKNLLLSRGYNIAIVADIHFYPPAAMLAVEFVDKIRINPGNFADPRAQFKKVEFENLDRIQEKLAPLIEKCKRFKKALRIGANLGSLSDRMMSQYGDTPRGMVESAIEYATICRSLDFHDIVFSMKASNPLIMIEAYRLLVQRMNELHWDYPLHLGVTEAGAGEEGRIKSGMGIGALLMDGLGDTIRVSLTEDPIQEIVPCRQLISYFEERIDQGIEPFEEKHRFVRRKCIPPFHREGAVIVPSSQQECESIAYSPEPKPDAVWFPESSLIRSISNRAESPCFLIQDSKWMPDENIPEFVLFFPNRSPIHETRYLIEQFKENNINIPVILCLSYSTSNDGWLIRLAADCGAILCDRLVEGICLISNQSWEEKTKLSFQILQSARYRITQTEYISCPGCGRTLFDLQSVARKVREETKNLPGLKIAIMGCIVNGPGEMADADFGLVGSKPGKLSLYHGKTCVETDIEMEDGPKRLIEFIRSVQKI